MKRGLSDERFWEIVDSYESGDMSLDECIQEICDSTNSYEVAMADLSLLVKRDITKEEKKKVKELLNGQNNRRSL